MLKLILGDGKGQIQNANVPVRWCVDKETLDLLAKEKAVNPHILIVTVSKKSWGYNYSYREKSRQLVSLDQVVEFIPFKTPGTNILYATIVWAKNGTDKELWEKYLKKEDRRYNTDLVHESSGDFFKPTENCIEFAEMEVHVPHEVFSKKRPKWLEEWVNLWFEKRVVDDCHFRKRAIIAFTIQPIAILIFLFLKITAGIIGAGALVVLLACKKVTIDPILHPFTDDLAYIQRNASSILYRKWTDKLGEEHVKWHMIPLIPIFPIAIFLFHYITNNAIANLYYYFGENYYGYGDFWISFSATLHIILEAIIMGAAVDLAIFITAKINARNASFESVEKKYKDEYYELLCDEGFSADLKTLASKPRRRKIHLLFQNLKASVCKPMPQ